MVASWDDRHNASAIDVLAHMFLLRPNKPPENAITNSEKNGIPPITVYALQGEQLAIQAQLINAKHVLAFGALGGHSTVWSVFTGAHVTSIEINPKHRDVLSKLAKEGKKLDLVIINEDWGEQWEYLEWAVKITWSRGCVYIDNVEWVTLESDATEGNAGEKTLVAKVGKVEWVQPTLVSTETSQKTKTDGTFDGLSLAVVQEGHRHQA